MDPRILTIDLETTGLSWQKDQIIIIGYRYDETGDVRFVNFQQGERGPSDFIEALANPKVIKRGHNVKFDVLFLLKQGYEVNGELDDTCLLCYLKDPFTSTHLKDQVETTLGRKVTRLEDLYEQTKVVKKLPKNRKVLNTQIDLDELKKYCAADVINCDDLRKTFNNNEWYTKVEQPLIKVLLKMEQRGIKLDIDHLKKLDKEYDKEIQEIEKLYQGTNLRSPKQVGTLIGTTCTDKLTLKHLNWSDDSNAGFLLRHREYSKLKSTYITPLLADSATDGRIHGSFNQAGTSGGSGGTKTGRLTSSGPNLQNIPDRTKSGKEIRRAFIPTDGYVMFDSDLKQIEPRLIAHYSQSKVLLKAFNEGLDTHGLMASGIFGKPVDKLTKMERFIGKTSWLATMYGCYYKKLKVISEMFSEDPIPYDEEFFKKVQEAFWRSNPDLLKWRYEEISLAKAVGYIRTLGGRTVQIPNLYTKNPWEQREVERQIINYKIQGSAADVMKLILVEFDSEYLCRGRYILGTIHDEVLGEFSNSLDKVHEVCSINDIMCNTVKLNNVPIEADTKIVKNWSEK